MTNLIKLGDITLTGEEKRRFRAYCCGLCRSIGDNFGMPCRLAFNYDIAFLIMFLSSAYNEKEYVKPAKCIKHPNRRCEYVICEIADYAAAISIALSYNRANAGKNTPKNLAVKKALAQKQMRIEKRHNKLCEAIKKQYEIIFSKGSFSKKSEACGDLISVIFSPFDDALCEDLSRFGYSFGKLLYAKSQKRTAELAALENECFQYYKALKLKKDRDIIEHIIFQNIDLSER